MTARPKTQLKSIFLTGLPRSGTTWASRAVQAATGGRLVHEPFNWKKHPGRIDYHMKYVPAPSNDTEITRILRQQMKPPIPFVSRFLPTRRVVIKDVHICLAVEHVWEKLRPLVIILVRHPCAVANSWANLELQVHFRLRLLLSQERLMQDHLSPFRSHMESTSDYFSEVGAYWGATHYVLKRLTRRHPEWKWITHEALSLQQAPCFERLLEELGLDLKKRGRESLRGFLRRNNRSREKEEGPYSLARVGAIEVEKWKRQLTTEQVEAVMHGVGPFGISTLLRSNKVTS